MALPIKDYQDRIAEMLEEAIANTKVMSDWPLMDATPPRWVVRLTGTPTSTWITSTDKIYVLTWNVLLVRGGVDASNKGEMQEIVLEDISAVIEYFDTHRDLLTDTQTAANDAIPFYIPGSVQFLTTGDQTGRNTRQEGYTIRLSHKNKTCN